MTDETRLLDPESSEWKALMHAAAALPPARPATEESWQTVAERIQTTRGSTVPTRFVHRTKWMFIGAAVAAVGILLLVNRRMPVAGESMTTYATAAGQRSEITLFDGTRVMLAPDSRLRLDPGYATGQRHVMLEGEAYFTVIHDVQHSFAVLANNISVTDVGTEFDVRAYDVRVRVAVAKGEISLHSQPPLPLTPSPVAFGAGRGKFINNAQEGGSEKRAPSAPVSAPRPYNGNDTAYLTAGDMAEATDTGFTVIHHADIAAATAWLQGRLAFKDTPLDQAIQDIARCYDLTITVADSTLLRQPITAAFAGQSADFVLDNVTAIVGARFERSGHRVVIRRRVVGAEQAVPAAVVPWRTAQGNRQ